jgi:serine palmitoyltransferase
MLERLKIHRQRRSARLDSPPALKPRTPQGASVRENAIVNETSACLSHERSSGDEERQARLDKQFGPIGSQSHRYLSMHMGDEFPEFIVDELAIYYLWTAYLSHFILTTIGRIRDYFGKRFRAYQYKHIKAADGYAPLNRDFDNFYCCKIRKGVACKGRGLVQR